MELKKLVYDKLDSMKINYSVINHKALFSRNDTDLTEFNDNVVIGKNLFLRNHNKNKYYLIILPLLKQVNLKELALKLDEKRFSFANENELDEYLKITPGSVSYLNVISAEILGGDFKNVTYIIDSDLTESEKVGFHPSDNTATVITDFDSILKVFDEYNIEYYIMDL